MEELMSLSLANRITFFRIFCVPIFILLISYYIQSVKHGNPNDFFRWAAVFLFLGTVFLDAVDGYIARTRNQITRLGTIIDPLADKALLLSALLLLSLPQPNSFSAQLPAWFVILVVSRDAILVLGAILIHFINGTVNVRPRISGKATTFLQMTLIAWVLTELPQNLLFIPLWSAAAFTFFSAIQYVMDGIMQFDKS
jgi:CDP-diacylglycerol--glycerol-3-phosphate 3-phosphatidyltransferase